MTDLEQRIVDQYLRFSYPDEPGTSLEDAAQQALVGTLPQDTTNITAKQFGKMAMDVPAALLKGGVQGTIGLPGDLISLGKGIAAAIRPNAGEGRVDAFLRGMEGKTLFPTTEDVRDFLDRTLGPVVPKSETDETRRKAAEMPEFIGELGGGGKTMVAGAKAAAKTAAAGAKFAAPKVGEMLDSYMRRTGMTMDLMAYHGTPHRLPAEEGAPLGRFRSEKIGTGEGAQSYGFGLYFAENPAIAGQYKISTSANQYETTNGMVRSQDLADEILKNVGQLDRQLQAAVYSKANVVVRDLIMGSSPESIVKAIRESKYANMYKGIADSVEALNPTKAKGNFYTVDIPDEMIGKMLDYDKPLGQQKEVLQKLKKAMQEIPYEGNRAFSGPRAFEIRTLLDSESKMRDYTPAGVFDLQDAAVVQWLREAGVPGVRYLDQGSRGAGDGTRNIVVFPGGEDQIKIVKVE
jgi:hypothetical protein